MRKNKDNKKYFEQAYLKYLECNNYTEASKYVIEKENLDLNVENFRRSLSHYISRKKKNGTFEEYCESIGINPNSVTNYWHKGKHYSVHTRPNQVNYEDVRDSIIESMKAYAPVYPKIERKPCNDGHLLVIDPCDVHIGKLANAMETGEDYNSEIAVQRVIEGVQGILDKSSGYNIEEILFIAGNDILHIDTPNRKTTSGTPQDTDGMWYDNFLKAKKLYIEVLEKLIAVANVKFVFNPSNHDYMSGFFLSDTIQSWFSKNENITFDVSISHRKYHRYHENLIGTTHGDGAKAENLPLLMAQEAKQDWGFTKHKYIYSHHLHHKVSKEYMGVTVETLRSPSGTDSWHHRNGYQHATKAIEAFIHHPANGQVSRIVHVF